LCSLDVYRNGWVTLKPEVAFEVLERHAGKLARVILRGLGVRNDSWLSDYYIKRNKIKALTMALYSLVMIPKTR
jgi:hypothetical protein